MFLPTSIAVSLFLPVEYVLLPSITSFWNNIHHGILDPVRVLACSWRCSFHACSWLCSFTSCRSALLASFHQDHSSVRLHPVCCFELCLLSGVAVCECVNLAPRAPYTHHLRSVVPWFVKGLRWFDELFARPRADPRVRCAWFGVTQNHSLPSSLHVCVEGAVSRAWFFAAWSWIPPCCVLCSCSVRRREYLVAEPVPRRSAHCAFRRTLLCSVSRDRALDCSGSSSSRRHPSQVISLSTDAIVIWFSLLRPPGCTPAEALCDSPQLSPLRLAVCLVVSGHSSTQTCSN